MSEPSESGLKKRAVISASSHVVRGSVGNRAAVFALETLGFPVWAVPTITLPWHPGHGPATRLVPEHGQFSRFTKDISSAPWVEEVGAVLTGYMANADQVSAIADMILELKRHNPNLVYLCDPVMGDGDGLYIAEETAIAIGSRLLPICDIATPNSFELAWLTQRNAPSTVRDTVQLAKQLDLPQLLVTSSPTGNDEMTGNTLCTENRVLLASHGKLRNPPNGPGDLTAALFLGHLLAGEKTEEALRKTTASVLDLLKLSMKRCSNELTLETDAARLLQPRSAIDLIEL